MTDNERIAKFMGQHVTLPGLRRNVMQKSYYADELKYDTSWDWLMPVVEKIEDLHDASYLCRIVSRRCIIYDTNIADQASVYQGSGAGILSAFVNQDSKLIATYKAVVEFIKWFETRGSEE